MLKYSIAFALFAATMSLQAETTTTTKNTTVNQPTSSNGNVIKKDEVMEEDQIDSTDTLAIPFDDSAVEDEQILDHAEGVKYEPFVPTNDAKKVSK